MRGGIASKAMLKMVPFETWKNMQSYRQSIPVQIIGFSIHLVNLNSLVSLNSLDYQWYLVLRTTKFKEALDYSVGTGTSRRNQFHRSWLLVSLSWDQYNISGPWITTSRRFSLVGKVGFSKNLFLSDFFENGNLFHSALINILLCTDKRCHYRDNDSIIFIFLQHHQLWYLFSDTAYQPLNSKPVMYICSYLNVSFYIVSFSSWLIKVTITISFIIHLDRKSVV